MSKNATATGDSRVVDLGSGPYDVLLELDEPGDAVAEIYGRRDADENWILLGTLTLDAADDPPAATGEIAFTYAQMKTTLTSLGVGVVATTSVAYR